MATAREVAVGLTEFCTTVPSAGDGVCARCHGCPGLGFDTCWSCSEVEAQVSRACELVVPVSLYEIPSQLHHILRSYKAGYPEPIAGRFRMQVAGLVGHFVAEHGPCIAAAGGGDWDVVTSVPSSGQRQG